MNKQSPTLHDVKAASPLVASLGRSSVVAFAVYGAGIGVTYLAQLAIARIAGVENYGIYSYVLAWISFLSYFCAQGFDVSLLRFIPPYRADRAWALLRGAIQYAERRALIISLITIIFGESIVIGLTTSLPRELHNTFVIGFMLIPVCALLWIRGSATRAFGGVVSALAPDRIVRDGILLALILFASWGLRLKVDAPLVMFATLIGAGTALATVSLALRRWRPLELKNVTPVYAAAIWRRTAWPLVIMTATEVLLNRTGVLVLGWVGDTKNAGIYSLVFNIALVITLPRMAINTLLSPSVSVLFNSDNHPMLRVLIARSARWTVIAAAFTGIALFVLADPLLGWFGVGYKAGLPALQVLVVGQVIAAVAGSQLQLMTMTGNERSAAALLILATVTNAVASFAFIRLFGLTGAAVAYCLTLIVWNLTMAYCLWRRLHFLPGLFAMLQTRQMLAWHRIAITDATN